MQRGYSLRRNIFMRFTKKATAVKSMDRQRAKKEPVPHGNRLFHKHLAFINFFTITKKYCNSSVFR